MGTRTTLMYGTITGLVIGILIVVVGLAMVILTPDDDMQTIQGKIIIMFSYFYLLPFHYFNLNKNIQRCLFC